MPILHPGDTFPDLDAVLVGGGRIRLPHSLHGSYGVVLLNRGSWCPFCRTQLESYQRAQDRLTAAGIRTVSLSADDEAEASAVATSLGITFPLGHSIDPGVVSDLTGAVVGPGARFVQSTGFLLDPVGRVIVSVYSTGAVGRLNVSDVTGMVAYLGGNSRHEHSA